MTRTGLQQTIREGGLWLALLALLALLAACQSSSLSLPVTLADGDASGEDGDQDAERVYLSCKSSADCPQSLGCDSEIGLCRQPVCQDDETCIAQKGADSQCIGGFCLGKTCQNGNDCSSDNYCSAHHCRRNDGCLNVQDIEVARFLPLVRTDDVRHLAALGKDSNGAAIPGVGFVWRSMNTDVATVGEGGVLRGGAFSGTTTLTVNLDPSAKNCAPKTLNATLTINNFAPIAAGQARVIVVDAENNERIEEATVVLEDGKGLSLLAHTDSDSGRGVALFSGVSLPLSVHVFHANYHYASLLGLTKNDLIVPLRRSESAQRVAGVRTQLDFSALGEPALGESAFAWFGLGVGAAHWDLGPLNGIAPKWRSNTLLGSLKPWPANVALTPNLLRQTPTLGLAAFAHEGPNTAWAIGGYVPADDMASILYSHYGVLDADDSSWMLSGLAYTEGFFHGQKSISALSSQSLIPDDGRMGTAPYDFADQNGDGQTDDWVPDFGSLPKIGTIPLVKRLDQTLLVTYGQAPYIGKVGAMIACVGGWDSNESFLPLGLAATLPEKLGDGRSAIPGSLQVHYAAPYGTLSGSYGVVAFSLPVESFFSGKGQFPFSAVVARPTLGSTSVQLGDFLPLVREAKVDLMRRTVRFSSVGAYPARLRFAKGGREWDIWFSEIATLNSAVEVRLPLPPYEDPLAESFEVLTMDLLDGSTLNELVSFSDSPSLTQLNSLIRRYSRAIIGADE